MGSATDLLDTQAAASYLNIKPHTLEIWRSVRRHEIPYIRVGKLIRYRRSVLDAWLEARTIHGGTADER
jgi:excisionase family DNA binding protein